MIATSIIILIDLGGAEGALTRNRVIVLIVYILCVLRVLVGGDVRPHEVVVVDELHVGKAAACPAHSSGLGLTSACARLVNLHKDLVMMESRVLARLSLMLLLSLLQLVVKCLKLLLLLVEHEALWLRIWVLVPVVAVVKCVLLECVLRDAYFGGEAVVLNVVVALLILSHHHI